MKEKKNVRLQAEGNSIPPNITFAELETPPLIPPYALEDQDYILIHTNTNTMTERPRYFNQIRQSFHNFQNFSKTQRPRGSNIRQKTITFYNSASKKQPKLVNLPKDNNKSTETTDPMDKFNCLLECSNSQSDKEGSFEFKE